MAVVPAATTELGAGRGSLIHASEVEIETIDKWREEVRALKPSKRRKWHSRLWNPCGVAEKVRYVGEVKFLQHGARLVSYEFESYKQQNRVVGGGAWWPVTDRKQSRAVWGLSDGSSFGQRMWQNPDRWQTWRSIQAEEAEETANERVNRVSYDILTALGKAPWEYFCASFAKLEREKGTVNGLAREAVLDTAVTFPAEFVEASRAVGRLPRELQELTDFLAKEVLSEAELKRKCKKLKKIATWHARAEQEAATRSSGTSDPATAAAPMPVANAPVALTGGLTEADKEVQRANEMAKERKLLAKKAVVQPPLVRPAVVADDAAGQSAPAEKNSSKNARRRQEKKLKQQQTQQRRTEEKQRRADEEFRKILKAVEPLRRESGTVVQEDLEHLDSLKKLDTQLKKEERQTKPRRAPTQAEAEVTHALLETGQLRGKMHQEVEAFVRGFAGIAPDAEGFAERLVDALLVGDGGRHDAREAAELYGDFADAYAAHSWMEPRLERVRRKVVLRAAALA